MTSFLQPAISHSVSCWSTSPTQDEYSFKMHLKIFHSVWPIMLLTFCHICSDSPMAWHFSKAVHHTHCSSPAAKWIGSCLGRSKEKTFKVQGKFQYTLGWSLWENICAAPARHQLRVIYIGLVPWLNEAINHFSPANSYLIVPLKVLFCHALSRVSPKHTTVPSKYSRSQMAGTPTVPWQNL